MRKNLRKLTQLSSQISRKICFRCNIKHSEECFITYPNTSKCVKKIRLRLVFSTHSSVFGYVVKHSSSCFMWYIQNEKAFFTTVSKHQEVCWNNFEVFWGRGKELFQDLYIASQTNQYLKRKLKWKLS